MSIRKEQKEGSAILYLIDEENRTVIAKIPQKNLLDALNREYCKYEIPLCVTNCPSSSYFVGVAKCSPEDEFDVEVGKRLAAARMLKKYYKTKLRMLNDAAEWLDKKMISLEDLMNNAWLAGNAHSQTEAEIIGYFPPNS